MIARPSRRVDGTPEPAPGPTPFADAALNLHVCGLAPIPLGGDNGKIPLVSWGRWERRPGRQFLERLAIEHPTANVGVLTGLIGIYGVTVVDIDDPKLVDPMVRRFGDTPLKIRTPSSGVHLWYMANGERCRNLRGSDDIAVDIKGVGGMVVVPPSVRPSGKHAGKAYIFLDGSWDDLCRLPQMNLATGAHATAAAENLWAVQEGARNSGLFRGCLDQASHCDTVDDLVDVARAINESYVPPLLDAQVEKIASSAWRYQIEGQNWRGTGSHVPIAERTFDRLMTFDKRHGPDALALYVKLRAKHATRDKRGESFAVASRAMARVKVLPWSEKRIYNAAKVLVGFGLLDRVRTGGNGKGDTSQYRFRSPPPALVPNLGTNVIEHPPPSISRGVKK